MTKIQILKDRPPTTELVWDMIAITYFNKKDTSHVYSMNNHVNQLKLEGGSLEIY